MRPPTTQLNTQNRISTLIGDANVERESAAAISYADDLPAGNNGGDAIPDIIATGARINTPDDDEIADVDIVRLETGAELPLIRAAIENIASSRGNGHILI